MCNAGFGLRQALCGQQLLMLGGLVHYMRVGKKLSYRIVQIT
jgi:hypothetical protein